MSSEFDANNSADTAILQIAYLLLALDGEVVGDELEAFKKVVYSFPNYKAGNTNANELFEDLMEKGEKLISLKKIYSEDELLTAFCTKIEKSIVTIKENDLMVRKAFAIWIGMCLADKEYADIERKAIKTLQNIFNKNLYSERMNSLKGGLIGASVGSVIPWLGKFDEVMTDRFNTSNYIITDSYLDEIEEYCSILLDIEKQINETQDEELKNDLQNSYNDGQELIQHLILNGNN